MGERMPAIDSSDRRHDECWPAHMESIMDE